MPRFANIPDNVKAVFPMNQKFVKGTSINPAVESKLDAVAQGLRTTMTAGGKQDIYAMNRLNPGDDIAFYNPEGNVVFAKHQETYPVPQEIFQPDSRQAKIDYGIGEGGNSKYTDATLLGGFNPHTIPLDVPFSQGRGYRPALSGNSQIMRYEPTSPVINFASQLPADSATPGTIDRLPKQIADKIRQQKLYEQQYADTGFYKDSHVNWKQSPINRQPGASPYFQDHLANSEYTDEALAANGFVRTENGEMQQVQWRNQGKSGVVPTVYLDGTRQPVTDNPGNINQYAPLYINKNYVNYAFNNPDKYGITAPRSSYNKTGEFTNSNGQVSHIYERNDIVPNDPGIKANQMQSADKELFNVNSLINQGGIGDIQERYYGSNDELSYDQIQALARRGGGGRWVDDVNSPDDYDAFKLSRTSQSGLMERGDLERGGLGIVSKYNQSTTPAQHVPSWGGGIAFNEAGMPVDYNTNKLEISPYQVFPSLPKLYQAPNALPNQLDKTGQLFVDRSNSINYQSPSDLNAQLPDNHWLGELQKAYQPSQYQTPLGYNNLTPASELLDSAPEYRNASQRNIQRITEESQLPPLTQLNSYFVNDYGVIEKSYITGKSPLSVQQYNGTLDPTQMASQGRWVGGGNLGKMKDRHANNFDPLDSNYNIRLPQGVDFKAELERSDPRLQQAWTQQQEALSRAASTPEDNFIPYQKNYDIKYDPNTQIFGTGDTGTRIEGAFLPALVEKKAEIFEPEYVPYIPNQSLLDQHLADVRVKLGDSYYPLTPEATTTQHLPSESQLSQAKVNMFGKRKYFADGRVVEYEDDGTNVPKENMFASARNNAVYNNPNIDGATDIVGALDKERQSIRNLSTIVNQRNPYTVNKGEGINLIDDYGSGKIDMQLFAKNPMMAMHQMVNITPKYSEQLNPLRESILYGRSEGQVNNQGLNATDRYVANQQQASIGNSTSLNRMINEDEANRIQQQMTIRPQRQKLVTNDDGTSYVADIDQSGVYQRDLEGIVDNPNNKLSLEEVAALLDNKIANYKSAKNTYTQLMNLEPQDEIAINAISKRPQKLADQMERYGLDVDVDENNINARGSLTAGLPGENIPNLPVTRFRQENVDQVIQALAQKGKATNQIVQIADGYRNALAQDNRMNQIGYPSKPQVLGDEVEAIQSQVINRAKQQAMLDRKADYFGDSIADMLASPTNNYQLPTLNNPGIGKTNVLGANDFRTEPNYHPTVNPTFSQPMFRGNYTPSPWDDPREVEMYQAQQVINQPGNQYLLSASQPSSQPQQQPQQPQPQPTNPSQQNQWLMPGLIGTGVLGVAGLSLYQQDQQRRRDEEAQLRGRFGYS